jgi:hypothetical protein
MLRLEFLPSGSHDCPLLRISGGDVDTCLQLKQTFEALANGELETVCISDLPGIEAIGEISLTASVGKRNRGVFRGGDSNSFHWSLTQAGWDNNAGLLEPLCQSPPAPCCFQWLDSPSDIGVLFSPSGQW